MVLFPRDNNEETKNSSRARVACEQALYSGGQRELFSLRAPKARRK